MPDDAITRETSSPAFLKTVVVAGNTGELGVDEDSQANKEFARKKRELELELAKQQVRDNTAKLVFRWILGIFFIALLVVQYVVIYEFSWIAYKQEQLTNLQWLLGTVFCGMLFETYKILQVIVSFIFSPTEYALHILSQQFQKET